MEAAEPTLLVFGGSGFLGGRVCEQAATAGFSVVATPLTSDAGQAAGVNWRRCDITDLNQVRSLIDDVYPSQIVNAAYRQSGDAVAEICADAPEAMALAARDVGARLVHISTDLVFDGDVGRPYREGDATSPLSAYGQAKADAEERVLSILPSAAVVRTSLIYGDPTAPQERLVRRAHDEGDVAFFTDEWRTAVHVDDLAGAVLNLVDPALNLNFAGLLHVAGAERQNRLQFAQHLAMSLNLDPTRLVGRTQDPALGPRASDVSLDTSLANSIGLALPGPSSRGGAGYS